jgi:NADP-dependent 3-hydroxy acid dehydrogenase YdfG
MSGRTKRIAWVTGGASGIGQAGAETLAADGWTVVISGRRPDALAATAEKIRASGGAVDVFPLDVTNADEIAAVTSAILAKYGRIDLLVNRCRLEPP